MGKGQMGAENAQHVCYYYVCSFECLLLGVERGLKTYQSMSCFESCI
jgi:hypothetical protein